MPPKIKPILKCMPWNVKQMIVEDADTRTKITLSQCTKEFKAYVEKSIIVYDRLSFVMNSWERENAFISWTFSDEPQKNHNGRIGEVTERFFNALKISSKVHLTMKELNLYFVRARINSDEFMNRKTKFLAELKAILSGLKEKLHVEKFEIQNEGISEDVLQILPLLKPGTLKTIVFSHLGLTTREMDLNAIAETDQWKQATSLMMPYISFQLPFQKWKHFNEIRIIRGLIVSVETVQEMMEYYTANPNFKRCEISGNVVDYRGCLQYFLRFNPLVTATRGDPGKFFGIDLKIETGESVMKIRVKKHNLRIEKVKRSDYVEDTGEDIVRLEAATLLAECEKYI